MCSLSKDWKKIKIKNKLIDLFELPLHIDISTSLLRLDIDVHTILIKDHFLIPKRPKLLQHSI